MAVATVTGKLFDILKRVYNPLAMYNVSIRPHALLDWLPKKESHFGEFEQISIHLRAGIGASAGLAAAANNYKESEIGKFFLTPKKKHRVVQMESEIIHRSKGDAQALYEAKEIEFKHAVEDLGEALARDVTGPGYGVLGVIAVGGIAGTTITLASSEQVFNFSPGMVLVAAANAITGAPRAGTMTVTGTNLNNNQITVDATVVGLAAGDSLFVNGDRTAAGPLACTSIAQYIPIVKPTALDAINGLSGATRVTYEVETSGWRLATFPGSIREAFEQLHVQMRRRGSEVQALWLSPLNYKRLKDELRTDGTPDSILWGVPGLMWNAGGTQSKVMVDAFLPDNIGYSLKKDSWVLKHMLSLPHLVQDDGQSMIRLPTAGDIDGIEARWRYYVELGCLKPIDNGVIAINYT